MEMQQFDLIKQFMLFEQVDSRQKLRNFQTKFRITTSYKFSQKRNDVLYEANDPAAIL